MGLMDKFKSEKDRLQTTEEKAKSFYDAEVIPLVQQLMEQVNADPDIKVKITNTGDASGLTHSERRAWYTFKAEFSDNRGQSLGVATLKLNQTEPRYVSPLGLDIGTAEGRSAAIDQMIREAAESKAKPREARVPRSERPIRRN